METNNQIQTYEEAVVKTVNWWAEQSFGGKLNQNNGDKSGTGDMVNMMANLLSLNAQKEVTADQIEKFKSKLTEILLAEDGERFHKQCLSVDYHPCQPLYDACEYAVISTSCLPIKTCTWIAIHNGTNEVTASLGYGAAPVVV